MAHALSLDMAALLRAAGDLRLLLDRGYPRARSLELVGDRHALPAQARHILRRGVHASPVAQERRAKLLPLAALAGQSVALDGHNQIITLEAALRGLPLVLGDDGLLRDIQGLGPRHQPDQTTWRAARLLCQALAGAGSVLFLLDAPLSRSGELAAELGRIMAELGLPGQARTAAVPEKELAAHPGPVASSDGEVVDAVSQPLDLAGRVIMSLQPPPAVIRLGQEEPHPMPDSRENHHA